jgi:hypothetical protein
MIVAPKALRRPDAAFNCGLRPRGQMKDFTRR